MSPGQIMVCMGTRPEVIKLAPVIKELERRGEDLMLVTTGQHREMLQQALDTFGLRPHIDLELMEPGQSLGNLTGRAIPALDAVIAEADPRVVVVQGDTTTAFCGALGAFYRRVPVAHVEAGLRTRVLTDPFPEEANRRLIGQLACWHFCPTPAAAENLLGEGVDATKVYVTGNTSIDAALSIAASSQRPVVNDNVSRRVLVTMHRRETQGDTQRRISRAIAQLAQREDVHIVFPVHLSPAVRKSVLPELAGRPNVTLCEPLDYRDLIDRLREVELVITDSGGLQEEAPAFDVPVLVMRETTERPEGVSAGCSVLCGTDPEAILAHARRLLDDPAIYARMANAQNPYGDGRAAARIVDVLLDDSEPSMVFRRASSPAATPQPGAVL